MPDNDKDAGPRAAVVGRVYRGEASPPMTTPAAAAANAIRFAKYAVKDGAVPVSTYFAIRGITSPIMQASMLAFTDVRVATVGDFDDLFAAHHGAVASNDGHGEETK